MSLYTHFDTRNRFGFGGTVFESTEPLVILSLLQQLALKCLMSVLSLFLLLKGLF